ncbi:S-4TM family putative pore-forming effector [Phytohabitans sp. ZYX-F-186]|uniref:S-4TM family putative pore-forming effector n=1 Tax=Phytohabitans maris TaxID=3071409 RepID=A0ABU0ZQR9_9ACTN|nr:S-4TM family putative pore-forming effector [Phytohabitans sp. ZYX-F-186]MDQ7909308.1 S-4TM family putative pore-forming effector [Phytohabitans sp. ZYX-F-186]
MESTVAPAPLSHRQNTREMAHLLKAMSAAHRRARRFDASYLSVSILVALSGLVATFVDVLAVPVSVVGGLWAVACGAGITAWTRREVQRAATIQEMFDVRLFELPWNTVAAGDPIGAAEVNWLAKRYRGGGSALRDYYDVPTLPRPYDVIACQMLNLAWGARIRRRYARTLLAGVFGWSAAGVVVGAFAGLTVTETVLWWYVPSLGVALVAWEAFRAQRDVAAGRERVLDLVWAEVRASAPGREAGLLEMARRVQDAILQTRTRDIRVPNWFFTRFAKADRADFRSVTAELAAVVRGRAAGGGPDAGG